MKRIIIAVVLALFFNVGTAAHDVSAPNKVPDSAFVPVPGPTGIPVIVDPLPTVTPTKPPLPKIIQPVIIKPKVPKPKIVLVKGSFLLDPEVSWYGPGFYGRRTACGLALTKTLIGVAHRTLPCGTLITFKWKTRIVTAPVVDRGPYVAGRQFDLTGGLCLALSHCFTGPVYYRIH